MEITNPYSLVTWVALYATTFKNFSQVIPCFCKSAIDVTFATFDNKINFFL